MVVIRRMVSQDVPAVVAIVVSLPEYFTEDAARQVGRDCSSHDTWVLTDSDQIAGFTVTERKSASGAEILWMAVAPGRRGRGIGTVLLNHVLDDLAGTEVRLVEVKTLDRSAGYPPYASTRAFWERRGFVQVDTIDPLPGWEPGNPAAIYVAALQPTR
jgi:GNAT superfamily N-acetyltransferase